MISIWHLFWIVPLSAMAGIFCIALVSAGGRDEFDEQDN